jgi:hypothetical protein
MCIDGAEVNEIAKQNKTAVFALAAERDDAPRAEPAGFLHRPWSDCGKSRQIVIVRLNKASARFAANVAN